MSNIRYNEKEEAYEIEYKLWGSAATVRFYVDSEQDIMDNFADVAQKLDKLDRNRKKIASLLMDEGYYEGGDPDVLAKKLTLENVYVDIDEDGVVVCFTTDSSDGYLSGKIAVEIGADNGIEIIGDTA